MNAFIKMYGYSKNIEEAQSKVQQIRGILGNSEKATWKLKDSSSYKDDSVEIYFK